MAALALHATGVGARRPFVITPYSLGADGSWTAALPQQCAWSSSVGVMCRVRINHARARKTGPSIALVVARCLSHRRSFTLYPPGHVPYGRVAIAPVAADGSLLVGDNASDHAWGTTVFAAALDASGGEAWPRWHRDEHPSASNPRRWRTQRRWLSLAAAILGVAASAEPVRERIARLLDVALLTLTDAAKQFAGAASYRGRGCAVVSVLTELRIALRTGDQLLASGASSGCWGEPRRWDPSIGRMRVFPTRGIPP